MVFSNIFLVRLPNLEKGLPSDTRNCILQNDIVDAFKELKPPAFVTLLTKINLNWAWFSNNTHGFVWLVIIHPSPNFNIITAEVKEGVCDYIPLTFCWNSLSVLLPSI